MDKERRLYRLLLILRKGYSELSVPELKQEFGVTERSIERDLMTLEGAGFCYDRVAKGRYRLNQEQDITIIRKPCTTKPRRNYAKSQWGSQTARFLANHR